MSFSLILTRHQKVRKVCHDSKKNQAQWIVQQSVPLQYLTWGDDGQQ